MLCQILRLSHLPPALDEQYLATPLAGRGTESLSLAAGANRIRTPGPGGRRYRVLITPDHDFPSEPSLPSVSEKPRLGVVTDGRWTPTFPNARYLFARQEWEHWRVAELRAEYTTEPYYEDSLLPIMESGQAELVATDYAFDDNVWIEP